MLDVIEIKDDMCLYSDRIYMSNGTRFSNVRKAALDSGVRLKRFADGTAAVFGSKEQLYDFLLFATDGLTQIVVV